MKTPQTTVKNNESHDRMSLTVKFEDGTGFRFNSSRYRESLSTKSGLTQDDLKALLKFCGKCESGETFGDRNRRLALFFFKFSSITEALAAVRGAA